MTNRKTLQEIKREYWSQPHMYFTPKMIDALVAEYGDKPATTGEAAYVLNVRVRELFNTLLEALPFVRRRP